MSTCNKSKLEIRNLSKSDILELLNFFINDQVTSKKDKLDSINNLKVLRNKLNRQINYLNKRSLVKPVNRKIGQTNSKFKTGEGLFIYIIGLLFDKARNFITYVRQKYMHLLNLPCAYIFTVNKYFIRLLSYIINSQKFTHKISFFNNFTYLSLIFYLENIIRKIKSVKNKQTISVKVVIFLMFFVVRSIILNCNTILIGTDKMSETETLNQADSTTSSVTSTSPNNTVKLNSQVTINKSITLINKSNKNKSLNKEEIIVLNNENTEKNKATVENLEFRIRQLEVLVHQLKTSLAKPADETPEIRSLINEFHTKQKEEATEKKLTLPLTRIPQRSTSKKVLMQQKENELQELKRNLQSMVKKSTKRDYIRNQSSVKRMADKSVDIYEAYTNKTLNNKEKQMKRQLIEQAFNNLEISSTTIPVPSTNLDDIQTRLVEEDENSSESDESIKVSNNNSKSKTIITDRMNRPNQQKQGLIDDFEYNLTEDEEDENKILKTSNSNSDIAGRDFVKGNRLSMEQKYSLLPLNQLYEYADPQKRNHRLSTSLLNMLEINASNQRTIAEQDSFNTSLPNGLNSIEHTRAEGSPEGANATTVAIETNSSFNTDMEYTENEQTVKSIESIDQQLIECTNKYNDSLNKINAEFKLAYESTLELNSSESNGNGDQIINNILHNTHTSRLENIQEKYDTLCNTLLSEHNSKIEELNQEKNTIITEQKHKKDQLNRTNGENLTAMQHQQIIGVTQTNTNLIPQQNSNENQVKQNQTPANQQHQTQTNTQQLQDTSLKINNDSNLRTTSTTSALPNDNHTPTASRVDNNTEYDWLRPTQDTPSTNKSVFSFKNNTKKSTWQLFRESISLKSPIEMEYLRKDRIQQLRNQQINDRMENDYPRSEYSVTLVGSHTEFLKYSKSTDLEKRMDELFRCKGFREVKFIDVVTNMVSKKLTMKIVTTVYDEYKKLLETWPVDAFGKGVKPETGHSGLMMIINVPITKDLTTCQDELKILAEKYGCCDLIRMGHAANPQNRCKTNMHTIKDFVDRTAARSVPFHQGLTNIQPNIKRTQPCDNCGQLVSHGYDEDGNRKICPNDARCLRCASCDPVHISEGKCKAQPECINCHKSHITKNFVCEMFRRKVVQDNDYVASILVGEGLITRKDEILKWVIKNYTQQENQYDEDKLQSMIDATVNPIKTEMQTMKSIQNDTIDRVKKLETGLIELKEDLKTEMKLNNEELKLELKTEIKQLREENIDNINKLTSTLTESLNTNLEDKLEAKFAKYFKAPVNVD
jgi:hypothetical protein